MSQIAPEVTARQARARRRRRFLLVIAAVPILAYVAVFVVRRAQIAEEGRAQARAEAAVKRLGGEVVHYRDHPIFNAFSKPTVQVNLLKGEIGDDDLAALDGFPDERLASLHLGRTRITDAGLARIARHRGLAVMSIGLGLGPDAESGPRGQRAAITDAGLAYLNGLPDLMNLSLHDVPITDRGLDRLGPLPKLIVLGLSGTKITEAGLARLPGVAPDLMYLDLGRCAITDEGIRHLARLPKLNHLMLNDTGLGDAGLESLRSLPKLRRLYLRRTRVTDAGLATIAKMPSLEMVDLKGTGATPAGVAALKQSRRWNNVIGP